MISGSFRIGRFAGISVFVHWTFLLLLAFIAMSSKRGGTEAMIFSVLFVITLFACVTLHEFGHALTARRFGIRTEDITLLPIGGVARLQKMPVKPYQEFLVAIAGPMVNVVIASVIYLFLRSIPEWDAPYDADEFLAALMWINVRLIEFNMLPAFPMDGGRVVRSVLAMFMNRVTATRIAAGLGKVMALVFAAWGFGLLTSFGLSPNFLLVFIAFFVYSGAAGEERQVINAELFGDCRVADAMTRDAQFVSPSEPLAHILARYEAGERYFIVMNGPSYLGLLTPRQLESVRATGADGQPVESAMAPTLQAVDAAAPLGVAADFMRRARVDALPVVQFGQLVGIITIDNLDARRRRR
jgi:Zn-dependent protease